MWPFKKKAEPERLVRYVDRWHSDRLDDLIKRADALIDSSAGTNRIQPRQREYDLKSVNARIRLMNSVQRARNAVDNAGRDLESAIRLFEGEF